ncbi:MAG: site-specific integrase [Desulfamplus sp.]|nr:site-specific integrase [Desulfamplus sp.]
MAKQERTKTKYAGVYYVIGQSVKGKSEKIYYIRYRKQGKSIEEKAGRQFQDDMTPARASGIRAQRIEGEQLSNTEKRLQDEKTANEKRWTIDELWKEYSSHKENNKNFRTDDSRYLKHIKPYFQYKLPGDIIPLDIDRLKRPLLKKYTPQTTKHVLALLKRIVNFGFKRGLTPALSFVIEMPNVDNIKDDALSDDELQRLFKAIENDEHLHAGNLMLMALFTGMRRGELFKLKWNDIDFQKGFIHIRNPKGGKDQIIPLNDQARAVLESHIKLDSEFVFPGKSGVQRTTIQRPVDKIKRAAGLPKDTRPLHSLRHTFATTALNSGIDLYTLQKLTTHKTAVMLQRYAHLSDERFKKGSSTAGDAMAEALKPNDNMVNIHK